VSVSGSDLSVVDSAKILGLTISSDLSWNAHVEDDIRSLRKQANASTFLSYSVARAGIPPKDIVNFYCTCVRSVLEYFFIIFILLQSFITILLLRTGLKLHGRKSSKLF